MKRLLINRIRQSSKQTEGEAELFDSKGETLFTFKTLELPWRNNERRVSRIPEGKYEAQPHRSPQFGKSVWIRNVPGRSEILLHLGNYVGSNNPRTERGDSLGCILVGKKFADITGNGINEVTHSAATIEKLYELIRKDNRLIVEIINTAPSTTGLY